MEIKTYQAEIFDSRRYRLAEAPFYDERTGIISFVDIIAGELHLIKPDGSRELIALGQQVGAAVPWEEPGSYLACATDGLYLVGEDNGARTITKICDTTGIFEDWQRCNDAKADPAGRLFVGTSAYKEGAPEGGNLYRVDLKAGEAGTPEFKVIRADTKISNGMAWNSDRTKFFFSDSSEHAVFVYDYDFASGDINNCKVLFDVTDGVSDGMCIDQEDNLWVAMWGGSRVEKRSSVTGELLAVVELPAKHVTSCCFLPDGRLLITSSGEDLDGEKDGMIFSCKL